MGAAALCAVNLVFCYFYLKEPVRKGRQARSLLPRFDFLTRKDRSLMILSFFMATLAMSVMEIMLFPYMEDEFGWGFKQSSLGFAYVGVMMVMVQGYFLRVALKRTNDKTLLVVGLSLFALSLFLIPLSPQIGMLAVVMTVLAFGSGFSRPASLGLISSWTEPEEQGRILGVTQSCGALARIVGPLMGGWAYDAWSRHAVFGVAGALALGGLAVALWSFSSEGRASGDLSREPEGYRGVEV